MRKGITEMGTSAQSCHLKLYPPFNLQACLVSHCSAHIPVCLSHNSLLPSSSYFLVSILQYPCYLCTWWPQPPTCRLSVPWPGPQPDLCLAGCQRSWLPWPHWLPELHFLWTCAGHSWPHAGPPVTHRVHPLPNLQPSDQQINNQVGAIIRADGAEVGVGWRLKSENVRVATGVTNYNCLKRKYYNLPISHASSLREHHHNQLQNHPPQP